MERKGVLDINLNNVFSFQQKEIIHLYIKGILNHLKAYVGLAAKLWNWVAFSWRQDAYLDLH